MNATFARLDREDLKHAHRLLLQEASSPGPRKRSQCGRRRGAVRPDRPLHTSISMSAPVTRTWSTSALTSTGSSIGTVYKQEGEPPVMGKGEVGVRKGRRFGARISQPHRSRILRTIPRWGCRSSTPPAMVEAQGTPTLARRGAASLCGRTTGTPGG
jgi:hypothetical protein